MNERVKVSKYGLDKNLASRTFEVVPLIYKERGKFLVGCYQYVAWVDNQIDESPTLSFSEKNKFLERQLSLLRGEIPEKIKPFESLFLELPWNQVPKDQVQKQVEIILYGVKDDLDSMPLGVRSKTSIKHTEWRTSLPTFRIASLVLNGTDLFITPNFAKLLKSWSAKDDINHFYKDLENGLLKIPLDPTMNPELNKQDLESKKRALLRFFTPHKLASIQWENISGMTRYALSIYETNLTQSQKFALLGYEMFRVISNSFKNLGRI